MHRVALMATQLLTVGALLVGLGAVGVATGALSRSAGPSSGTSAGSIIFTRMSGAKPSDPDSGRPDLFVVAPDGSNVRLLVRNASSASVSLDGRRIAFVRDDAIWRGRLDGSGQHRLTRPPKGMDSDPAWSGDGRTIFFTRDVGGSWSIFSVRIDGTGLRRLTKGAGNWNLGGQSDAAPSPREDIVAYTDYGYGGGDEIESIEAITTTGRPAQLGFSQYTLADVDYRFDPAWAPSGRRLAFGAFVQNPVGWSGIYVSGPAKAAPRRVARPSRVADYLVGPAWSADGRWIAFTNDSEKRSQVWLVRDDGRALRRLTTGNADSDPVWLRATS